MIRKGYIDTPVEGGVIQTHLRRAGSGQPLLMLHPSPMSSAFLVPVIDLAREHFAVIAPDTPGYGGTDPLPNPAQSLVEYTHWVAALLDALGLQKAFVYGSATGAQIAIEFARAFPDRTHALVLENAVHFSEQEVDDIMVNYFPSLEPKADGSHLDVAWQMANGLFRGFPWYEHLEDHGKDRGLGGQPQLALVQATAMAYLNAGPDYDRAYRAAFANERAEHLAAVTVPVRVMRWAGGLLKAYADRLDGFDWPDHITLVNSGPSPQERFEALGRVFRELA